ncbi:diguanylate cyclase [Alkaliphilus oremlandii]|uniref:Diguanylate cyclase n=1 Tax=Alkaliphilus oremlandii (strain OhILAs) TaxID=350688 RepID=A8MM09_ALKOO|nr:diguanylate cyclase [Alkaliphilus oremlandii]ABW18176.1 diguanylate cyclase [Alkaliphilus oremlandii OhILAs]
MVNSLFINASILISVLYLTSQIFKEQKITSQSDLKTKISVGILFGLTGCLLMFNGFSLPSNMIMDFRVIALIISLIYCGSISSIITVMILIVFRLSYFGGHTASLLAAANLTTLWIILNMILKTKLDFAKKYIVMIVVNICTSFIATWILIRDVNMVFNVVARYALATAIVSTVVYFVLSYIYRTNELYLRLKEEATRDFLTGLYNVREFEKVTNELFATIVQRKENLSLLMIDIDFFKKVNDTFGHSSGDLVLKQLSTIITSSCRSFDIVSRQGGEEFTVILLGCDHKTALEIAERIRKNVEDHLFIIDKNEEIKITVSIGVSSYPEVTNDPHHLLHEADDALYFAKRNGRNLVK